MLIKLKKSLITPMFEAASGSVISQSDLFKATGRNVMDFTMSDRVDWFEPSYVKVDVVLNGGPFAEGDGPTFIVKGDCPVSFIVNNRCTVPVQITKDDVETAVNEMVAKKIIAQEFSEPIENPEPHVEDYQKDGFN